MIDTVLAQPARGIERKKRAEAKPGGSLSRNSKKAATSVPRNHEQQASHSGKSWFDERSSFEELLQPFASVTAGAITGGVTTFLQNKLWPETKPAPMEAPSQAEPPPDTKEIPSFTAHLAGWDQALIGIGDARRNNIPKKPLLPVR